MTVGITVREYLKERRLQIQREMRALKDELADVHAAERALAKPLEESSEHKAPEGEQSGTSGTLKELAMAALSNMPRGGTAQDIIAEIRRERGVIVQRPSLSPQLSRLAAEAKIGRAGRVWFVIGPSVIGGDDADLENASQDSEDELL